MNSSIKYILKKTALFLAVPAIALIALVILLSYLNTKSFNNYKISNTISNLVIGDSHVQQAIDDSIVQNCINLSQNSEAFYFSYYKLKGLLKNNPFVKTVYLGFSYHSLSSSYDAAVFGKYSKDVSSRYFFILPFSGEIKLLKSNSRELPAYLKNTILDGIHNVLSKTGKSFLGNYQSNFKNTRAVKSSMDKRIQYQFYNDGKLDDFSNFNISYLYKIADLCKTYNIKLILLNTPLQAYYKKQIPQPYINKYTEIINANNFKVIDFHNVALDDSCFIPDGDHLSAKGSAIISSYLNQLIIK